MGALQERKKQLQKKLIKMKKKHWKNQSTSNKIRHLERDTTKKDTRLIKTYIRTFLLNRKMMLALMILQTSKNGTMSLQTLKNLRKIKLFHWNMKINLCTTESLL